MRTSSRLSYRVLLGLVALTGLFVTATVNADPIKEFTGYTRIGSPPTQGKKSAEYKAVAAFPEALGATVYYMVFDRQTNKVVSASHDIFGTGFANFDKTLVAGLNSDRPNLDTKARYLYLYQIVNDSGLQAGVKDITIRLLVPTYRITSWGHFVERTKDAKSGLVDRRGLGFSTPATIKEKGEGKEAAAVREVIRPVSTDFQGVNSPDEPYTLPGTPHEAPKTYGVTAISLLPRGAVVPAAAAIAPGQDPGKEPNAVMLMHNADFSKTRGLTGSPMPDLALRLTDRLNRFDGNLDLDDDTSRRAPLRWRTSWPALRATWTDSPIAPKQRSVIFGFTSDDGPTTEAAALTPRPAINRPAVGAPDPGTVKAAAAVAERVTGVAGAVLPVDSTGGLVVPAVGATSVPVPALPASAPQGGGLAAAPGGGGLGGIGGGGLGGVGGVPFGGGIGGGGFPGGVAGRFAPAGIVGGGGIGGGTGSGNGTTGAGTTTGTTTGTGTTVTVNQNVNQNQSQSQSQRQGQFQLQGQRQGQRQVNVNIDRHGHHGHHGHHGNIVPAPPAWLLGVLGMPVFMFVSRRRKAAAEVLDNPGN